MREPLTEREKACLEFIKKFIEDKGYPPSRLEIGDGLLLYNDSSIQRVIESLKSKGYIWYEKNSMRSITITGYKVKLVKVSLDNN